MVEVICAKHNKDVPEILMDNFAHKNRLLRAITFTFFKLFLQAIFLTVAWKQQESFESWQITLIPISQILN